MYTHIHDRLAGMDQSEQSRIMHLFKTGALNVLVATSIAEEGLDVGEVDLCVFFESVGSPIRLVQRMGRTGRKRAGKVVMLVNEGKEERKLEGGDDASKAIDKLLRNPANFRFHRMNPKVSKHCQLSLTHIHVLQSLLSSIVHIKRFQLNNPYISYVRITGAASRLQPNYIPTRYRCLRTISL